MSTIRLTGEADHNPGYLPTDVYVSLVRNATRAGRNVSYKLQAAFDVLISQPGSFPNVEPIRRAVHESTVRRLIEVAQDIRWLPADCPIDEMQSVLSNLLWERSEYWWEVCIGTAFTNETPVEIMRDLAYVNWPADALPLGQKESPRASESSEPKRRVRGVVMEDFAERIAATRGPTGRALSHRELAKLIGVTNTKTISRYANGAPIEKDLYATIDRVLAENTPNSTLKEPDSTLKRRKLHS